MTATLLQCYDRSSCLTCIPVCMGSSLPWFLPVLLGIVPTTSIGLPWFLALNPGSGNFSLILFAP